MTNNISSMHPRIPDPNLDTIHVVLAVYDPSGTYSQHAGVTITSIFEHTRNPVIVYILHDETMTETNRHKFIRTAGKYSQSLEFIDISQYKNKLLEGGELEKVSEKWTIGTLYRIFVPEVLLSLDKVIYLDCDVLVNLDISELWNISLDDKSLAGVRDELCYRNISRFSERGVELKLIGCDTSSYINAGITVMNLQKFRALGNFSGIALKWLLRYSHLPLYPDQDAINSIFFNDIKFIDEKFNVYNLTGNRDFDNCIIHVYRKKPWLGLTGTETERIYWKNYLRSAWGENMTYDDIVDMFSRMAVKFQESPFYHYRASKCAIRLIKGSIGKIYKSLEPLRAIMLFIKDRIFYR